MSFLRNVARVLRDQDGNVDSEVIGLALGATALALGVATYAATQSLSWALAAVALGLPAQLAGLAYKPSAYVVGALGTLLVGGTALMAAGLIARALTGSAIAGWAIAGPLGVGCAVLAVSGFRQVTRKLDAPGWY